MLTDRLLASFRVFLVVWGGYVLAHFTYVQLRTDWGAKVVAFDSNNFWDPIYFGVVNATLVIVPFLLFQIPIARRFGGWSSAVGRVLYLYGIGTSLWGLGNLYWFIQNVRGVAAPYPSLADAGYLAVLPFAAAALWQLAKVVGLTGNDWKWLPLALLVAFPLNAYIMLPQGVGAGTFDTPMSTIISSTYIVSDVVLLAVSIIVAFGARRAAGGRFLAPTLAVVASLALLYVGDLFFNYRIAKDLFYNAEISDLLYGAFIIASSMAAYFFLRADVRAKAAIAALDEAWVPDLEQVEQTSGPQLEPLDQLATAIVRGQGRMMGEQTARSIASGVHGIGLREDSTVHAIDAVAIDALVREYRSIAGPLGEMTSWTAARPVFARYPELDVSSLARFRTEPTSGSEPLLVR